mgnify:CR=1 FL=1
MSATVDAIVTAAAGEPTPRRIMVAALVAQESTFVRDIRSHAGAYGLMQIMPPTGKELAGRLRIPFADKRLENPEINIRLGTLYFSRLVEQFGGAHFALASYNAGENRVVRWKAERPGLDQDEFIDDIPFPETQNYVKRILGTAEDYRALYGPGGGGQGAAGGRHHRRDAGQRLGRAGGEWSAGGVEPAYGRRIGKPLGRVGRGPRRRDRAEARVDGRLRRHQCPPRRRSPETPRRRARDGLAQSPPPRFHRNWIQFLR